MEMKTWIQKIWRPKLNFYLLDMPRLLRRSLLKENSWRRSSLLLPQAEVESESWTQDEKIKTRVETRVNETNAFSPEETSESYAHAFHFSTMANQQTIALSGEIKGRKWSLKPGPQRRTAHFIKWSLHKWGILLTEKESCGNQKKFKIALKKFLYTYSFYTVEEYLS